MIIIDGQKTDLEVNNFNNLEDLLVRVMENQNLGERIVTDVMVNDESFSEIYPHQAEDLDTSDLEKVEIRTTDTTSMAVNITQELHKVITLMSQGGSQVATLFRNEENTQALEIYQDLLTVVRDFMNTVTILRDELQFNDHHKLRQGMEKLSELFSEMLELQEQQSWKLLADLLEYEFLPLVQEWSQVVTEIRNELQPNV